jgi:predicted deacetylase
VRSSADRTLAVALHDVEPATFARCAELRDWLDAHGVDRVTLLVIPARDLHSVGARCPELVDWLAERTRLGDSIAQHGFQHERLRRAGWPQRLLAPAHTARGAEFVGLGDEETRRAVEAGWRVLKLAGIEPEGFVAPAYAYTPALRRALPARFRWWATLMGLHGAISAGQTRTEPERSWHRFAPALSFASEGGASQALSPILIRAGELLAGRTMRLDLHPSDLESPSRMKALERVLARTVSQRAAATYDQLARAELRASGQTQEGTWVGSTA